MAHSKPRSTLLPGGDPGWLGCPRGASRAKVTRNSLREINNPSEAFCAQKISIKPCLAVSVSLKKSKRHLTQVLSPGVVTESKKLSKSTKAITSLHKGDAITHINIIK